MKNYRIVVEPPRKGVLLVESKIPVFESNEVLIQTIYLGICKTDEEIVDCLYGEAPKNERYLTIGHEAIGRVIRIGKEVKNLREGDLVVPTVRRGCSRCKPCLEERSDMCSTGDYLERGIKGLNGYMTNYFVENERYLLKVPNNLKDLSVLLEPLSIGEKAVKQFFEVQKGLGIYKNIDEIKALVEGSGPIGLLASFILRGLGIETYTLDRRSEDSLKPEILRNIGAYHINVKERSIENLVNDGFKFDLIVEATGNSLFTFESLRLLGINGILVMTGLPCNNNEDSLRLDMLMKDMVLKNQSLIGIVNSNLKHFEMALYDLKEFRSIFDNEIDRIITKIVDFDKYEEAFKKRNSDKEIKTVIKFSD